MYIRVVLAASEFKLALAPHESCTTHDHDISDGDSYSTAVSRNDAIRFTSTA